MTKERRLSNEELALWRWAVRQASPLHHGTTGRGTLIPLKTSPSSAPLRASPVLRQPMRPPAIVSPPRSAAPALRLDPVLVRRLARGKRRIDAILDLHGARQNEAYMRLGRFIEEAVVRGHRTLLVITGKGSPLKVGLEGEPGVLRRMVPEWLRQAPQAVHISGFESAHQRHGGGGAFYVLLRRRN